LWNETAVRSTACWSYYSPTRHPDLGEFTSEGMNYFYSGLFDLVERMLPLDLEEVPATISLSRMKMVSGQPRLTLLFHLAVGTLDQKGCLCVSAMRLRKVRVASLHDRYLGKRRNLQNQAGNPSFERSRKGFASAYLYDE
jgi:hypothetical protein